MIFLPIPETEGAYNAFLGPHTDYRATLVEVWNKKQIRRNSDWSTFNPIQINFVSIGKGTLRGIHRTLKNVRPRKVVTCVAGKVLDVLIDLRPG